MRIQRCTSAWFATAVCMMVGLSFANADDAPGIVRMTDYQPNPVQQTGFTCNHKSNSGGCCGDSCGESACCPSVSDCCPAAVGCTNAGECCPSGGCDSGCNSTNGSHSGGCGCGCCGREPCSLLGKMFGGPKSRCSCDSCEYCGKGCRRHCGSGTLFDCLFGSMTPSGACCQGAPLCGKYQITYADKPAYADPRDGQAWGAQGYGMPITVPTAPVVRYSYNYSHGTPASRLTPLSTYSPVTSPQSLWWQSWH